MTELFTEISSDMKQMITSYIDMAFKTIEPLQLPKMINDFTNSMPTETLQNFVDFYFNLKLEELRNGNNSNQR